MPDSTSQAPILDLAATWQAARKHAVLIPGDDRGLLRAEGADAPDFLHRILTSDVLALAPGGGQWSALLDRKGRWQADILLFRLPGPGDPAFLLDCPREVQTGLAQGLDGLRFGERLVLAEDPAAAARLLVLGPGAPAALSAAGLPLPDDAGEAAVASGGDGLRILRRPDRGAPCLELAGTPAAVAEVAAALELPRGASGALELLRIAAFRPRFAADFGPEDLLPEAEEWQRVSFTKGCYPGQEVVAKIRTYGEAPWRLARLRATVEAAAGSPPALAGAPLLAGDGSEAGRITSWAVLPGEGEGRGLARVRRRYAGESRFQVPLAGGFLVVESTVPPPPER